MKHHHRVAKNNPRQRRRSPSVVSSILFWALLIQCLCPFHSNNLAAQAQSVDYADFLVTSDRSDIMNTAEHFVARIIDPATIAQARAELVKEEGFKIIAGTIEKTAVDWNPGWSYHLLPDTIFFGDFFIQVCDASATYVEENLDAAGGSFLPRLQWCPWGTRVLEEITSTGPSPRPPQPQPRPTMAPALPPPRCAARGEICTEKMQCCSADDVCRGVCARKTTNNKAGDKSNLKLDFDSVVRGMRDGTRQRRILKGSS
jgi:hypothetical protein